MGNKQVAMYVTGCREGVLAIWNPAGECIVRKQMFGRIQGIFVRGNHLATAHFGKPFDAGSITIRQVRSCLDKLLRLMKAKNILNYEMS